MDSSSLQDRFFRSFFHFNFVLKAFGINLQCSRDSQPTANRWVIKALSAFWLIINLQSALYLLFKRALRDLHISMVTAETSSSQMDAFNGFITCINPFLFFCVTHIYLIITGRGTIKGLLGKLSVLDSQMGQPDLVPSIRPYSLTAIVWIVLIVSIQLVCSIIWRLNSWEFTNFFEWLYVIQEWFGIQSEIFTLFSVWIYVVCIQLIQIYCKTIFANIEQMEKFEMDSIIRSVHHFHQLQQANDFIQKRFGLSLMINYCFILIIMVNASYFAIVRIRMGDIVIFIWDFPHAIEALLRLLLLCQFSDRIRCSASELSSLVRKVRDEYSSVMASSERLKMTLLVVELSNQGRGSTIPRLLGMFPLSKLIVLQATETAITFLVILYQFRMLEQGRQVA